MNAPEWKNTFRVGVYTYEMVFRPDRELKVAWKPAVPRKLSNQDMDAYRRGRDSLLAEIGAALGGRVAVIEL
jgi:hypothetical protein